MDFAYLELELDAVEARGAGRVPQEMAKNPALPGDQVAPLHPDGINPMMLAAKKAKTLAAVGTESTQVFRTKES